jgi:hypothetical protein
MADTILMSSRFWQQTSVRLVRTFAQAAGGTLGASATGALQADWKQAMSVGLAAAAIAFLMSLEKVEELPATSAEDKAVDEMMKRQGIDSGAPLPPLPQTSSTTPATTVAASPTSYVPPKTTPPPPVSTTPPISAPVYSSSAPVTAPATTSGYPGPGDPV